MKSKTTARDERRRANNLGGAGRNRTADRGFADLGLTTWLPRLLGKTGKKTLARGEGRDIWSGRRDLNPRLRPWQGRTLPLSYSRLFSHSTALAHFLPIHCTRKSLPLIGARLFSAARPTPARQEMPTDDLERSSPCGCRARSRSSCSYSVIADAPVGK